MKPSEEVHKEISFSGKNKRKQRVSGEVEWKGNPEGDALKKKLSLSFVKNLEIYLLTAEQVCVFHAISLSLNLSSFHIETMVYTLL